MQICFFILGGIIALGFFMPPGTPGFIQQPGLFHIFISKPAFFLLPGGLFILIGLLLNIILKLIRKRYRNHIK
jgi:hypothetical protein